MVVWVEMSLKRIDHHVPYRAGYVEYQYDGAIPAELRDAASRYRGFIQCCAAIRRRQRIYDRVTRELDEMAAGRVDRVRADYCWREFAVCRRALTALYHRLAYFLSLESNG